jgi:hypothetical protein
MPLAKEDLDKILADTKQKSELGDKLHAFTVGIGEALKGMAGHAAAMNTGGTNKALALFQKELDAAHTTLEDNQTDIKAAFGIAPPPAAKPAVAATPAKPIVPPIIPATPARPTP